MLYEVITHGEELKRVNLLEINVDPEEFFWKLMAEVKKTYDLGIIHGDLSEFNILIDSEGDFVIIDWPQAIEVGKKGKLDKLPFEEVEYDEEYEHRLDAHPVRLRRFRLLDAVAGDVRRVIEAREQRAVGRGVV